MRKNCRSATVFLRYRLQDDEARAKDYAAERKALQK
jgi:hypothetical protein